MIDVIIPTCKRTEDVQRLIEEVEQTAGCPVRVLATCTEASAAINRNIGLNWSESDPVVMIDDDITRLPFGWVKDLTDAMMERAKCAMIAARLLRPNGTPGFMMGFDGRQERAGVQLVNDTKLCTACIAMRKTDLRFEEGLIGSGYEDNDICYQIRAKDPEAEFWVHCGVCVVHLNEMKNQRGTFWEHNRAFMKQKWGFI